MSNGLTQWAKWIVGLAVAFVLLFLVWTIYRAGQSALAVMCLAGFSLAMYVYIAKRAYTWRYLFPGLAGMTLFVIFPLVYTVRIGFTNYSSKNLLPFDRATQYLLDETVSGDGPSYEFTLHREGGSYRLVLTTKVDQPEAAAEPSMFGGGEASGEEAPAAQAPAAPAASPKPIETFVSAPFKMGAGQVQIVKAELVADPKRVPQDALPLESLIANRAALRQVRVQLPGDKQASMLGLREFGSVRKVFTKNADGTLLVNVDTDRLKKGEVLKPNFKSGFYENAAGEQERPGFKVGVGFGNYMSILKDPDFSGPFFKIFIWTVAFATLTVLLTLGVGMTLAVVLNWEALKGRTFYRTLLFLPYAVPGFISILVFRGLFNQSFGEINLILGKLFGLRPDWFANEWLARLMILIVNTWLGYPYIMVLCTGLIKAIPADIYEASAIEGAGPLRNFFRITSPLILKPLTPLLVASFAFNFNNYSLISLLTRGRPDYPDTVVPAGTTDILVTYLYRIAFEDSGQQFGLAAAIATIIFVLVAVLSIINLRLTKSNAQEAQY